jgi:phage gpG-like protein
MNGQEIEVDASGIINNISKLEKKLADSKNILDQLGEFAKNQIKSRTKAGKDYKGQKFLPYSEAYKKTRIKHGRPVSTVDLWLTGKMIPAMTKKTQQNQVDIFFVGAENNMKAGVIQSGKYPRARTPKPRTFFRLSDPDKKEIDDMVSKWLKS